MENFLYSNHGALLIAAIIRAALNVNHKLVLFKNELVVSVSTVYDDLEEADFSGYVRKTVAMNPAFLDPDLNGASIEQFVQWDYDPSDLTPTTNTVYGYALIKSPGGGAPDEIVAIRQFPAGVAMSGEGMSIPTLFKLNYGG